MTAKNEAPADPARTLALLWGLHGKAGRKGLNVNAIVAAGIALADTEGLDAVSMRRVAERLDVGAMSLYTHVPGKTDLVDLMHDAVLGGLYADLDEPTRVPDGWRGGLEFIAERNWDLYRRHPWMLSLVGARPVLGPNTSLKYEAELRPLDGIGLTDVEMDSVLTLVLTHVVGTARLLASVAQTAENSGLTDAQWWDITGPILERLMDPAKYPVSGRVGEAASAHYEAATDPVHALRFGLDRILDGVAALISERTSDQSETE
ncbi:TetR/AcrR family transcriptional regulator [Rhodococcus sp. NPDC058514]|uniref:TetR/AcrR family transcriptional regulator n=1 Tax=unclassified Rhodococcus (in: high G+C Gram-positive bacteria) TaxID=192944 RepID=UPI00364621FD